MKKNFVKKIFNFKALVSKTSYIVIGIVATALISTTMAAWNTHKNPGDPLTSSDWNGMVTALTDVINKTTDIFSDGAGNVGIGTSTPNAKLQIVGKATSSSTITTDVATTLTTKDYVDTTVAGSSLTGTTNGNDTFLGINSGSSNTTGLDNTFLGVNSGRYNTTGYRNTFLGLDSGYYNTTGFKNTFLGISSGYSNTTGYSNTFLGSNSGHSNTTGYANTFLGLYSGHSNTTGYANTFLGAESGYYNTTGLENAFLGAGSGYWNTTGYRNNFLGLSSGYWNTTGYRNNFLGFNSGYWNTTGYANIFLGPSSGYWNTTGSYNILIGNNIYSAPTSTASNYLNIGNAIYGYMTGGGISVVGGVLTASDRRFKKQISPIKNALEKLLTIQGVSYQYRTKKFPQRHFKKGQDIGVIAQDVEQQFPQIVNTDDQGYKSVKYSRLVSPIIEAIRELKNSVDTLIVRVDDLFTKYVGQEQKIKDLTTRLEKLEAKK